jgi:TonB family protein
VEFEVSRIKVVMATRFNGIALLAVLSFGFVNSRSVAADIDEPQNLYMPGLTISGRQTDNGQPVLGLKHYLERCDILLWVASDGVVRIAQVIKSTGHSRLDDACLHAAIGQRLTPAQTKNGPVDHWAILPVTWDLAGKNPTAPDRLDPAIAPMAPNQSLRITARDYPKGALQREEQGNAWVHVDVSDTGAILDVKITKSSGSPELDRATLDAVSIAHFSPAFIDHKAVNSDADIVIAWKLPESNPSSTSDAQPTH